MDGKKTRFELNTGSLVLTRNTERASSGGAAVFFGIGDERDPQEVLALADASVEWLFEVIEEQGSNLRIRLEVPEGLTILRADMFERTHPSQWENTKKLWAKRTPLHCFAHRSLIQRVILYKSSMQKMIQRSDLLKLYQETGFLPLVRMNFWQESLRGEPRLVVTLMSVSGTTIFGKTPLLESPFA